MVTVGCWQELLKQAVHPIGAPLHWEEVEQDDPQVKPVVGVGTAAKVVLQVPDCPLEVTRREYVPDPKSAVKGLPPPTATYEPLPGGMASQEYVPFPPEAYTLYVPGAELLGGRLQLTTGTGVAVGAALTQAPDVGMVTTCSAEGDGTQSPLVPG